MYSLIPFERFSNALLIDDSVGQMIAIESFLAKDSLIMLLIVSIRSLLLAWIANASNASFLILFSDLLAKNISGCSRHILGTIEESTAPRLVTTYSEILLVASMSSSGREVSLLCLLIFLIPKLMSLIIDLASMASSDLMIMPWTDFLRSGIVTTVPTLISSAEK